MMRLFRFSLVAWLLFPSVVGSWLFPRDSSSPLRFREASVELGASHAGLGRGVATWDLNGDGWYDMVVGRMLDQTVLYLGRPGGFTRNEQSTVLLAEFDAWGFLVLDYDGDDDPDLYISRSGFMGGGLNSLLRFDGVRDGVPVYTDVSLESGAADPGAGLTSIAADYDRDGDVDIYVINGSAYYYDRTDLKTNALLRNNGDGTFTDVAAAAGVADQGNGMGGCWADFNRDGELDLFIINLYQENVLYLNRGDGTFTDVAAAAGVASPARTHGMGVADFDRDGDLDLYISNGAMQDAKAEELTELFLNDSPQVGKMLSVTLVGADKNRYAAGAEVTLVFGDGRRQLRMVTAGLGFGSQNPFPLTFGLGHAKPKRLVVKWPRGGTQTIEAPFRSLSLRITEDGKKVEPLPRSGAHSDLRR